MILLPYLLVALAPPAVPHADKTVRRISIGDITVTGFTRSRAAQGESGFHVEGPGTTVEIPDTAGHSRLTLHADKIDGKPEGADPAGYIRMSGHLRYRVQRVENGRISAASGTAGGASLRRSDHIIHLNGGVKSAITDSATLSGPALVAAQNADIDLSRAAFRLTLAGAPSQAELRFTPLHAGSAAAQNSIDIVQFQRGEFQPGETTEFEGKPVVARVTAQDSRTSVSLRSESIRAEYANGALTAVRATRPVRASARQEASSLSQTAEGSAGAAAFLVNDQRLELTGGSEMRLFNRDRLVGPGLLKSGSAVLDLRSRPFRYAASGRSETNTVEFTTRPPLHSTAEPIHVKVFGYDQVRQLSESEVEFTGPDTDMEMAALVSGRTGSLRAAKLRVKLLAGNAGIQRVSAAEHVRYTLHAPIDRARTRWLTGTADAAEIEMPAGAADRQTVTLHRADCSLVSPDRLAGPATIRAARLVMISEHGKSTLSATGDPAAADIRAALKPGQPAAAGAAVTTVHLYNFRSATFVDGKAFRAEGAQAALDINDAKAPQFAAIRAERIELTIDAATGAPAVATADGENTHITARQRVAPSAQKRAAERSADATCSKATYDFVMQKLTCSGGVQAVAGDSVMLAEPCTIQADRLDMWLAEPFYRVQVLAGTPGSAQSTDVRLTLNPPPPAATKPALPAKTKPAPDHKPPARSPLAIRLEKFDESTLRIGAGAAAHGSATKLTLARQAPAQTEILAAPSISLDLTPDGADLDGAHAEGGVTLDARSGSGDTLQGIRATCGQAHYAGPIETLRLEGSVHASISDTARLAEPASVVCDTLTVSLAETGNLFHASGSPSVNDILFTARDRAEDGANQKAGQKARKAAGANPKAGQKARKAAGPTTMHATGFDDAVLQTGSAISLTGAGSGISMQQPQSGTHGEVHAPRITGALDEKVPSGFSISARGGSAFNFTFPTASGKISQSYSGNAASFQFVQDTEKHLDVTGPLTVHVDNPEELEEPGVITGAAEETIHLNTSSGQMKYSWDTSADPIIMHFHPKSRAVPNPPVPANKRNR